jgi:AcrR family transcriptional regulator
MKKRQATETAPAAPRKARGRPRSFDREAALDAALEVFWDKGYESASISDLTAAMGINPPSLYAAFGDKDQLFLAAVDRYQARAGESCPYCDEPTARGALERLLVYMVTQLTQSGHPRGCLMTMAASTSGSASEALQKALADKRANARERMRVRIKEGIRDGDVPPDADPSALADFYSTLMAGMSQQARDGASRKSLLATVARAMQLFPAAPAAKKRRRAEAAAAA